MGAAGKRGIATGLHPSQVRLVRVTQYRSAPLTDDVAGAMAAFFRGGAGPSHSDVSRVLTSCGYSDNYVYREDVQGPNKQSRVLSAFGAAKRNPSRGREMVDGLLGLLRLANLIGTDDPSEDEIRLRRALGSSAWYLDDHGHLHAFAGLDVDTGGREALDEQLDRLRRSTADPGLLIGQAKDLLESVAKFVLQELGMDVGTKLDFNGVWYLARERLGILPQHVDPDLPGAAAIREIHQSTWRIAEQTNSLRNLQGTGHGRTVPTGVSEELALLVVREACTVAEYMLSLLNRAKGH